jgi:DNA repair exonuclease SbcCD ATPase subunit
MSAKTKVKVSTKIALKAPKPLKAPEPVEWCIKDLDLDSFEKIYHMSDIHIRPLQRHDEFKAVFTRVQQALEILIPGSTVTVITGDVFDNKTVFRPETFKLCRDLFKMITKYTPLVLIAGNHDMMENNTNRLDAITPVIDDIPNLHYLKYSGLYFSKNPKLCFVASSLYDKEFIHFNDIKESKHYREGYEYVALYHGALNGAKTDVGYVVGSDVDADTDTDMDTDTDNEPAGSTRYRSVKDFNNFDAVLLGDIHKHQILEHRNIAYAGSLIQQNHGESLDGHGILVWDTATWKCKLQAISNDYGFVDIICQDGDWINQEVELPKNCYARLIIKNCTETQIDVLVATLKERVGTLNITKRQCISDNINEFEIPPDIQRKDDELVLIREQAESSGYDADRLLELHKEYQDELDIEAKGMSTAVWRPVLLEFKNMFGYGDNTPNKMFFKQGITSISAGNTCGKTSIVNIILFAIFGRTPLNPSNTTYTFDIINNKQTSGYVKILLNHGGQYYLIERATVRENTKMVASPILKKLNRYDFSCIIWESNIKGDKLKNRTEVRKNNNDTCIKELFGDINDFSLSNLLNKESSLDLLCMTPAEQVKTLKKLFKLEIYDSYRDFNKTKLSEIEKNIADARIKRQTLEPLVDTSITQDLLDETTQQVNENTMLYASMNDALKILHDDKQNFNAALHKVETNIQPVRVDDLPSPDEEAGIHKELEILSANLPESTGTRSETLEYKLEDLQRQIDTVSGNLTVIDNLPSKSELQGELDTLKEQLESLGSIDLKSATMASLNRELGKISTNIDLLELRIKELEAVGTGTEGTEGMDLEEVRNKLIPLSSNFEAVQKRLDELNLLLTADAEQVDANSIKQEISLHRMDISRLRSENNMLNIKRNKDLHIDAPASVSVSAIEELEQTLIPDIPGIKYAVKPNELEKVQEHKDQIMSSLKEFDCERSVETIIQELLDAPSQNEDLLISVALANDTIAQLENGDAIKKSELDLDRATNHLEQLQNKIKVNEDIDHNLIILSDIAQIRWIENESSILCIEKEIQSKELLLDQEKIHQEYDHLCQEEEKHYTNQDLQVTITYLENRDKLAAARSEHALQCDLLHQKEVHLQYLELQHNITLVEKDLDTYDEISDMKRKLSRVEILKQETMIQWETQLRYERYCDLIDIQNRLEIVVQNAELQETKAGLESDLAHISHDIEVQDKELKECTTELNKIQDGLSVMTYRFTEQMNIKEKLQATESELIEMETNIIPYQNYNNIMGNKGITSKLLFNKIKSIEDYINTIIQTFTKYVIHILYDDKKQSISIITENKETHNYLSTSRLSGYEKLMLQIAFKRALNKFSYNSKSSLIIIDEALDCIDQDNFMTKLPDVMNLVTQDYSNCLAISQRDISHISDSIVTIKRQGESSSIQQ